VNNAQYPQIADDYESGFRVLKALPCNVFLGAHGGYYAMEEKYARLKSGGTNPYIDSEGYQSYVAEREQAFLSELKKQTAAAKDK
jgi:metallo-beta-lactamase class B